jgi:hypothetical protein
MSDCILPCKSISSRVSFPYQFVILNILTYFSDWSGLPILEQDDSPSIPNLSEPTRRQSRHRNSSIMQALRGERCWGVYDKEQDDGSEEECCTMYWMYVSFLYYPFLFSIYLSHAPIRYISRTNPHTRARTLILGDIHQAPSPVIARNTVVMAPKRSASPSKSSDRQCHAEKIRTYSGGWLAGQYSIRWGPFAYTYTW